MKFTSTVVIDAPREKVVELFQDVSKFKEWQEGFVSLEHLSGLAGTLGAKSKIVYKSGKHVTELTETIIVNYLPNEKSALYEHEHMVNTMKNRFKPLGAGQTRYDAEIEYTQFIGFMPRMMALLMPGVFRKQVQKRLDRFKTFVEERSKE
jgi:uncharacterized membrane protein